MTSRAATWNNWISRETDMRASAKDMVHGRCNGIGKCVKGVARSERDGGEGNRGWTTAEDIQVDGKKTGKRTRLWVINEWGRDSVHATGSEWMVGERRATRTTEEKVGE
jgi:hypothetical protein